MTLHTNHTIQPSSVPGIEVNFIDAREPPKDPTLSIESLDESGSIVGIDRAQNRLDNFLLQLRNLNFRYAISGQNYMKDSAYRTEYKAIRQKFLEDLAGIFNG